jgi:EAL domain-containing protein (putative c-di-GMP-specific phosphodiesterase class I)
VSAVAGLGRSLRIDTVAEGVETEDQFLLVRAAGCTHAQGYLFGRPCPAAELRCERFGETAREIKVA